ncbi:MAG: hypothetical protein QQN41_06375, partial [Nitrosopumilus sp.]
FKGFSFLLCLFRGESYVAVNAQLALHIPVMAYLNAKAKYDFRFLLREMILQSICLLTIMRITVRRKISLPARTVFG